MRAHLYMLGAALFDEPRPEHHDALRALMWRVIYRSPVDARWVPPLLEIADTHEHADELRAEYARLFILGKPKVLAQPYGSYWLENEQTLMSRSTAEVRTLMRHHGVDVDRRSGLLPDHLVSELEFMAYLADHHALESTLTTQATLLHEHLAVWVPRFAAALRACEPPLFYRMAAHFLREVIAWDCRRVPAPSRAIAA